MPQKRSRSATEQRFQDAVLELVGESGFAHIGINQVAERAGSDKVLIYRYFGGVAELLQRVAESRIWLPSVDSFCSNNSMEPVRILSDLLQGITLHVRNDPAIHQIALWRFAVKNPLTRQFNDEWETLWQQLPTRLGEGLNYRSRDRWQRSCELLSLMIQAELDGTAVHKGCLDLLSEQLDPPTIGPTPQTTAEQNEYTLPTNLL